MCLGAPIPLLISVAKDLRGRSSDVQYRSTRLGLPYSLLLVLQARKFPMCSVCTAWLVRG
jgi:hypothetical protein